MLARAAFSGRRRILTEPTKIIVSSMQRVKDKIFEYEENLYWYLSGLYATRALEFGSSVRMRHPPKNAARGNTIASEGFCRSRNRKMDSYVKHVSSGLPVLNYGAIMSTS